MSGINVNSFPASGPNAMAHNPDEQQSSVNWNSYQNPAAYIQPTNNNNWFDQQQHFQASNSLQNSQHQAGLAQQNGRNLNFQKPMNPNFPQAQVPTNNMGKNMPAQPFQASNAFANNNNNSDGWGGEDWGDWNDNSNAGVQNTAHDSLSFFNQQPQHQQQQQPQQQQLVQPPPAQSPFLPTNSIPSQQHMQQVRQADQSNRNYLINPATPLQPPTLFSNPAQKPPAQHFPQQHFPQHPIMNPQLPPTGLQPVHQYQTPNISHNTMDSFATNRAPPSSNQYQPNNHSLASTDNFTPNNTLNQSLPPVSLQSYQTNNISQKISDSFAADNSWNWSMSDEQNTPTTSTTETNVTDYAIAPIPTFEKVSPNVVPPPQQNLSEHTLIDHHSTINTQSFGAPPFSLPDDAKNTPIVKPHSQINRIKNETLSPQWSIESQVSQTSSDRSIESETIESRSSNTVTSDDGLIGTRSQVENLENIKTTYGTDTLDETLVSLNIYTDSAPVPPKKVVAPRESSFPPPPPSISQTENITPILKSSSRTPPLPPPPAEVVLPPPPAKTAKDAPKNLNPYKRIGSSHHSPSPQLITQPLMMPTSTNFYYQQNPMDVINLETLQPENLELPDNKTDNVENLEIAPNNDRNQYLQTGHLSEDGYTNNSTHDSSTDYNDNLPPAGLSRFVLGQQKPENHQQTINNFPEPPPGLDRMIPGTDLENSTDLNLERQADGEVSNLTPANVRNFTATQVQQPEVHQNNMNINDRNYYMVPGESDTHSQQRVIPGVEDDRSSLNTFSQNLIQEINLIPINEQQRELIMDGENLQDNPQVTEITRDEPIEGGNTMDESIVINQTETDSNLTIENPRKEPSNTSTCDESDKDRSAFYKKSGKKEEDYGGYKRPIKNKSRERYDTEDTDYSDREKVNREREGSAGVDRRKDRDKDKRKEGSGRDRDYDRDRDRDRNRYDRDRERYTRGKYDRESKYETDGSKYETERSTRYEKDDKRYTSREDFYRKRDERDDRDRRYRKDKDRDRDDRKKDDRYRDGREKRRDRHDRRYEYDDAYYRTGSRNTGGDRERERGERGRDSRERDPKEKDRKYDQAYYGQGYNYNHYAYYNQHQQYYETLRRTNPQAYAEWYRSYYSQMQTHAQRDLLTTDGRESVHSGRSSANEKERYNRPQQFYNPDDYHRQFNQAQSSVILDQSFLSETSGQMPPMPLYQQNRGTPLDRSYQSESGYYQQRIDNNPDASLSMEAKSMVQPERLTPCKFTVTHSVASVSCGILVSVKPKFSSNGITDVVKIFNLGVNDATRKLYQSYPGPLVRGFTHKKSVIEFCEDQLRAGPPLFGHVKSRGNSVNSLHSFGQLNKGSFTLLWNYLILLLRQNGTFVGTDISELLMKNKTEFPFESIHSSIKSGNVSGRNSSQSHNERKMNDNRSVDENSHKSEEDEEDSVEKSDLSEVEITDKFRSYLIYGNISEALEWATENNLWGHALFLASKVDRRQHANVMMKFANKLPLNDPLQTLYQLMSGRTPASVTSILDEKWGDWRPHLAMLMSNSSEKPELIKKSITTLADSLHNRGDLYGSHFCYLLSDVTFGRYSNVKQDSSLISSSASAIRLILLGSSHHRSFKEFSTNEAIMMTEIYEYARSLNEEKFIIFELQYYKYLLATRMLDYGMQLKCLLYMEQIAHQIQQQPFQYDAEFVQKVYTLGDRLKYYDPVLEKALDESIDNIGQGNIYAKVDDPKWLQNLRSIISDHSTGASSAYDASVVNNAQSYENNQDYSNNNSYADYQGNVSNNSAAMNQENYQPAPTEFSDINKEFSDINQQFSQLNMQYNSENFVGEPPHQQQQQPVQPIQQFEQNRSHNYHPDEAPPSAPTVDNNNFDQPNVYSNIPAPNMGEYMPAPIANAEPQPNYDYWNQNAPMNEMPKPTISMPNSLPNKSAFNDGVDSDSTQPQKTPDRHGARTANNDTANRSLLSNDNKAPNQSGTSTWFGGIWNRITLKPKNQMILPDDKNPTIVWDPEKKKWINTDGEESVEESFKPPPKMTPMPMAAPTPLNNINKNIVHPPSTAAIPSQPQAEQIPAQPMATPIHTVTAPKVGEPTKVPLLQSNMYKMQRNRTLKNSYVDVFNPSGAPPSRPTETIMAPTMPTMATPQSGFFVPGQVPAPQPNDSQPEGVPQFYNPNQYSGYQQ